MSIKVQNLTKQVIPLVMPTELGGDQVNIGPKKTIMLAISKATAQINFLVSANKLRIKQG